MITMDELLKNNKTLRIIKHTECKRDDGTVVSFDTAIVGERYKVVIVSGTDKNNIETVLVLGGDSE